MKVGLVLSGGGAKGSYQAGVVRALADYRVDVSMVSGASIGALNGGVIASAPNLAVAADRLGEIWKEVGALSPLEIDKVGVATRYFSLLVSLGLPMTRVGYTMLLSLTSAVAGPSEFFQKNEDDPGWGKRGVLRNERLEKLLQKYVDFDRLSCSIPFYVSLFRHKIQLESLYQCLKGMGPFPVESRESIFKKIQDLEVADRKPALLASAAIPVLFRAQKVEGEYYSDGGQGNMSVLQGNTPIGPLLGKGLDCIIVSHLDDDTPWPRDKFQGENILELHPKGISFPGGLKDMLAFEDGKVEQWMSQGERDTKDTLERVFRLASLRRDMKDNEGELATVAQSTEVSKNTEAAREILQRLDSRTE